MVWESAEVSLCTHGRPDADVKPRRGGLTAVGKRTQGSAVQPSWGLSSCMTSDVSALECRWKYRALRKMSDTGLAGGSSDRSEKGEAIGLYSPETSRMARGQGRESWAGDRCLPSLLAGAGCTAVWRDPALLLGAVLLNPSGAAEKLLSGEV